MANTQHNFGSEPKAIISRPLQDWPLSWLVDEVEADYNDGKQIRFDVLSELIFRAEAGSANP